MTFIHELKKRNDAGILISQYKSGLDLAFYIVFALAAKINILNKPDQSGR